MSYDYREKKIVAILDERLTPGIAMNALGHLAYSAGRYSGDEMMGREKIIDADGNSHIGISKYPFIVLKANVDEIKKIIKMAKENSIFVVDYPHEMFDTGHDDELCSAIEKAKEPDIMYHAAILIGSSDQLKKLTGHLRLYA